MAVFDLYQGKGNGNRLAEGSAAVNDGASIATGLGTITGVVFGILGSNTVDVRVASLSGGNVFLSLASPQVATATAILTYATVTVINTVYFVATGS